MILWKFINKLLYFLYLQCFSCVQASVCVAILLLADVRALHFDRDITSLLYQDEQKLLKKMHIPTILGTTDRTHFQDRSRCYIRVCLPQKLPVIICAIFSIKKSRRRYTYPPTWAPDISGPDVDVRVRRLQKPHQNYLISYTKMHKIFWRWCWYPVTWFPDTFEVKIYMYPL